MTLDQLYTRFPLRSGASTPVAMSRDGANFVFGPFPKDFTLSGTYYAKHDPLRTTDPNWYVTNAPEVLLYGALLDAESFILNDPRIETWRVLYDRAIQSLMDEERAASGARMKKAAWG